MKKQFVTLSSSLILFSSHAQLTYVPDDAFEAYLESFTMLSNGTPGDNYISTTGATNFPALEINGSIYPVTDFTGLEAFLGLNVLKLSSFFSSSINISMGTSPSPFIQITNCPSVAQLFLPQQFCGLLITYNSSLQNIIFPSNTQVVYGIGVQSIQITNNNSLQNLDFTQCSFNNSINLLISQNNSLECVNLHNGDCTVLIGASFLSNSILGCVEVDNPTYSANASTWTWMNGSTNMDQYYSTSCSNCTLGLEETMQAFTLSPNPVNDQLNITVPSSFVGEIFHVLNAQGDEVQHGVLSSEQHAISVEQLPAGVYVLTIDGLEPKRVVKL
jgi:hypothetical protein